ncbi:glucosaminidase domain-containing protein [Flavobacterium urocaniciphilum]|uniref:Peptidoglycan hydrolase n=1 Tax=Flavobacterium urocaniciphilum TaxID=1299341 RepID=A0A1H9AUL4_9FLAO|nr:glucosaminidase domain-containing protein [Flavobacterium urocaniciphilum]SEP80492.1 Flagellum-specific peptidoglycan hydrolase FlgJ [Flavobacterium urocaniciphilum]
MTKKILILFLSVLFISCGGSKIRTTSTKTHPVTKKHPIKTTTNEKPVVKVTPTETKTTGSEVLVATSKVKATTEDVKKYILDFKETAKNNMKTHGVPASITMAQGILESGAGFGDLAKQANNHFGIKCHTGWTGESVKYDDDAEQECFRKYKDPAESYKDHSLFLTSRKRYENLFKLDKGDYEGWANGLKQAGYATDSLYPSKLIGIIERYELYKIDNEVLGRNFVPKPRVVVQVEGEHVVQQGDTLYSLSKKYGITVDELKSLNNIMDTGIAIGQKLKVKK